MPRIRGGISPARDGVRVHGIYEEMLRREREWARRSRTVLADPSDPSAGCFRRPAHLLEALEAGEPVTVAAWQLGGRRVRVPESLRPGNCRGARWRVTADDVVERTVSPTLLSGFAGDHPSWRTEYSQLAQYTLQAYPTGQLSSETCEGLLTDLRLAGDEDSVKQCAQKLLMTGPRDAVRRACTSVNLLESTHSTGLSDLEFVASAAEVIEREQADNFVREAVDILEDQRRYAKRVRPTFLIHNYVLKTLESLMRDSAVSKAGRRVFIDFFLSRPAITDQSFAHSLVRVLKAMPEDDWTTDDLDQLRLRADDNWELKEALVGITAAGVDDAREELLGALRDGSTRMLGSVADVRNLPQDVAEAQILALSESVRREAEEARAGTFYRHDSRSLALLNIWHPNIAEWAPIYELINEFRVMPGSLISLFTLIRDASKHIRPEIRDELLPRLVYVRDRTPINFGEWLAASRELRTVVREAIDALAPGTLSDPELWTLVGGNSEERSAAARIIGRRRDLSRIDVLACLSHDEATTVRAAAAQWIARWLENAEVAERCAFRQVIWPHHRYELWPHLV
jgi:hypothetical protein